MMIIMITVKVGKHCGRGGCGRVETQWWRVLKVEETDVDVDECDVKDGGDDVGRRESDGWRGWWHDGRSVWG